MNRITQDQLQKKLIHIATSHRKIHNNSEIVVPDGLERLSATALFNREDSNHVLELGAGWGEFCADQVMNHPDQEYVAFEIKPERIKSLIRSLRKIQCDRVKIIPINFNWFLEEILPENAFDTIFINFPDPWPKRRHWKHRLVQNGFIERIKPLLRPDATIHLATDYGPYARKMLSLFRKRNDFSPVYTWPNYIRSTPDGFIKTRFEEMHEAENKRSYYMGWKLK